MTKKKLQRMKEWDFVAVFAYAVLILYSLIIIYLLFFAVITALKNNYDFTNDHNIFGLPNVGKYALSLENFQNAVEYMKIQIRGREYAGVFAQFIYALMYAFGCTIANVFSKVFAAYFCSKFKTKFGRILYVVSVVAMILPVVGTMASTIRIMRLLNIYNTYQGIVLYNASFWGPYFLVFYAAFKGIPDTYAEAARMDGAGHFMIFFRIHIPLIAPTIFAVAILQFIMFWNDYQTPLVYLESMPTISYGLYRFSTTSHADNAPALLSASLLVCIPIVILFVLFKNMIMQNMTAGGIKG